MGVVPMIDVSGERGEVAAAIDAACRDVGFFQIVGHGVDAALEADAWSAAGKFFRLPLADRLAVSIPDGDAYGYGSFAIERLAASLGEATPPDLKETFSIGPPPERAEVVDDPAAAFVYSATPWPSTMPGLEPIMRRYYDALALLVRRLMSLMATGLGLDGDTFNPSIDRHTSALRLLHYPDLSGHGVRPGQMRAGAHSDYGTLTLLRQDDAPGGLQVRDVAGEWHDVPAVDGAYVVNVGDALERWTNDRWRSTVHRVVVPPADAGRDCARQSIAFFHNANWDAVIECLPGCADAGTGPKYPPVGAGRHLMDKFRSTQ
ncbi:isopenicillin N synthase family dioxygenase [Ilumatobacter sp.]|uniref:isopenicillin N synthase family dioxygenase n=1 Tax=Ilumatobacter sp. TaxID=1967498 RepID=UPI003AF5297A